jgi:hypothetical protein
MWLHHFDNSIIIFETMGTALTDKMKRTCLIKNINERFSNRLAVVARSFDKNELSSDI